MHARALNNLVRAIERRVTVRKLWRCKAGWGMTFVLSTEQAREHDVHNLTAIRAHEIACASQAKRDAEFARLKKPTRDQVMAHVGQSRKTDEYELNGTVFAYYDTLLDCVLAEYIVWVLGLERPSRGSVRRLTKNKNVIK